MVEKTPSKKLSINSEFSLRRYSEYSETPDKKESLSNPHSEDPNEDVMIISGIVHLLDEIKQNEIDTLVFLDKSSRPLAHIARRTFALTGEAHPRIRFIAPDLSKDEIDEFDDEGTISPSDEKVAEVRNRFMKDPSSNWGHVLIIDERISSGKSIQMAKQLLLQGIPEKIDAITTTDVLAMYPSWYSNPDLIGVYQKTDTPPDKTTTDRYDPHSQSQFAHGVHPTQESSKEFRKRLNGLALYCKAMIDARDKNHEKSLYECLAWKNIIGRNKPKNDPLVTLSQSDVQKVLEEITTYEPSTQIYLLMQFEDEYLNGRLTLSDDHAPGFFNPDSEIWKPVSEMILQLLSHPT